MSGSPPQLAPSKKTRATKPSTKNVKPSMANVGQAPKRSSPTPEPSPHRSFPNRLYTDVERRGYSHAAHRSLFNRVPPEDLVKPRTLREWSDIVRLPLAARIPANEWTANEHKKTQLEFLAFWARNYPQKNCDDAYNKFFFINPKLPMVAVPKKWRQPTANPAKLVQENEDKFDKFNLGKEIYRTSPLGLLDKTDPNWIEALPTEIKSNLKKKQIAEHKLKKSRNEPSESPLGHVDTPPPARQNPTKSHFQKLFRIEMQKARRFNQKMDPNYKHQKLPKTAEEWEDWNKDYYKKFVSSQTPSPNTISTPILYRYNLEQWLEHLKTTGGEISLQAIEAEQERQRIELAKNAALATLSQTLVPLETTPPPVVVLTQTPQQPQIDLEAVRERLRVLKKDYAKNRAEGYTPQNNEEQYRRQNVIRQLKAMLNTYAPSQPIPNTPSPTPTPTPSPPPRQSPLTPSLSPQDSPSISPQQYQTQRVSQGFSPQPLLSQGFSPQALPSQIFSQPLPLPSQTQTPQQPLSEAELLQYMTERQIQMEHLRNTEQEQQRLQDARWREMVANLPSLEPQSPLPPTPPPQLLQAQSTPINLITPPPISQTAIGTPDKQFLKEMRADATIQSQYQQAREAVRRQPFLKERMFNPNFPNDINDLKIKTVFEKLLKLNILLAVKNEQTSIPEMSYTATDGQKWVFFLAPKGIQKMLKIYAAKDRGSTNPHYASFKPIEYQSKEAQNLEKAYFSLRDQLDQAQAPPPPPPLPTPSPPPEVIVINTPTPSPPPQLSQLLGSMSPLPQNTFAPSPVFSSLSVSPLGPPPPRQPPRKRRRLQQDFTQPSPSSSSYESSQTQTQTQGASQYRSNSSSRSRSQSRRRSRTSTPVKSGDRSDTPTQSLR